MNETQNKPFVIAGPCSAESEEQVHTITQNLAKNGQVDLVRAGIWKPRTRPGGFEGVGEVGLKWLVDAGKENNIPVVTEVANKRHVELALKAGLDAVWIGARTVSNPFSIQEIADALNGSKIPVFIKNALNPDLNLWVGAIERIKNAGINNVTAIHRGFSSYEKTKYRNIPLWNIPIKLMQIFPDVPIVCDPSHICGNTELIHAVSQKALDLNMFGLMIETHPNPAVALSDQKQQITPDHLVNILNDLVNRSPHPRDGENYILDNLRSKIDEIDDVIFTALAQRFQVVEDVAAYKKHKNMTVVQIDRWSQILEQRKKSGKHMGLREEFVDQFLESIHNESVNKQINIINKKLD